MEVSLLGCVKQTTKLIRTYRLETSVTRLLFLSLSSQQLQLITIDVNSSLKKIPFISLLKCTCEHLSAIVMYVQVENNFKSWFSLPTWTTGIKLQLLDLVASTFT